MNYKHFKALETFKQNNPRIDGFQEAFSVKAKTVEIKILDDSVFRNYLKSKKLPDGLEKEALKVAEELKQFSETQKLVVRRAYVVPGLENPPGPRFLGLKPNEVVSAVRKTYDFAIEHEYYTKKGSQIAVFLTPFVDPKPLSMPIKRGVQLPYGGYATPLNKEASRVEVFAVWGNNEGVQSFDAVDRYVVNAERKMVLEKDTPQKTLMFCTTKKSQSDKIGVPQDKQFEQVLSDLEVLEAARVVRELTQKYGPRRVEFSFDGKDTIVFNESVPYTPYERKITKLDKKGTILKVANDEDVQKLQELDEKEVEKTILYIDRKIVEERAYDTLNSLASLPSKFTVLYPGLSATAHAMRVLNDFGHVAIVVGNRTFKEGEDVIIKTKNGQITIDLVAKESIRNLIVHLYDARLYGRESVGGKAINLSLLKSKGFNAPHGEVFTTKFFNEIVTKIIGKKELSQLEKSEIPDAELVARITKKKFSIPDRLWKKVFKTAGFKKNIKYAVRSSANLEDHQEHSFAGQFKTFLNVGFDDIRDKTTEVIRDTFDPRIAQYLKAVGKPWSVKMAVVIQEMVDVDKAGVVFGKDIQTGNEDFIVIDVARGLGEGVVEGTAKTQRIIYSKNQNNLISKSQGEAKRILSRMEIDALIEMALSVERLMGETQDIEWAIDKKGNIWLLQTRVLG